MIAVGNHRFLDIQVPALVLACAALLLLLHELSYVPEVVLPELVPVHWHVHVQLLDLREYLGELVLSLWLCDH